MRGGLRGGGLGEHEAGEPAIALSCAPRWLVVRFAEEHLTASWAFLGGGIRGARAVAFHQVSDDELKPPVDARAFFRGRLERAGLSDAIGLLTSRDVGSYTDVERTRDGLAARCIATVGMGNALRAGDPPGPTARIGTINLLCRVSVPLRDEALLEALALAAEARALAVYESGIASTLSGSRASGTGTDCIVIAAPHAPRRARYAGKHTALGHVIGASVLEAARTGIEGWKQARQQASEVGP
jgi:adenosylcobinamide amidohydrolase